MRLLNGSVAKSGTKTELLFVQNPTPLAPTHRPALELGAKSYRAARYRQRLLFQQRVARSSAASKSGGWPERPSTLPSSRHV